MIPTQKIYQKFLFALFRMQEQQLVIGMKKVARKYKINTKIIFHTMYNHALKFVVS